MSVIVWDGKTLAADRRASIYGTRIGVTCKIHREGPRLLSYSGYASTGLALVAWFKMGAKREDFPESAKRSEDNFWTTLMVIEPNLNTGADILIYEGTPEPIRYCNQTYAIGSGSPYALAALYLGKDAREAVEVACALDSSCGNGVDEAELGHTSFSGIGKQG